MTFKLRHRDAKRLLLGGAIAMLLAGTANVLLGGTAGLLWITIIGLGFLAFVVAMIYFISNPIQRKS